MKTSTRFLYALVGSIASVILGAVLGCNLCTCPGGFFIMSGVVVGLISLIGWVISGVSEYVRTRNKPVDTTYLWYVFLASIILIIFGGISSFICDPYGSCPQTFLTYIGTACLIISFPILGIALIVKNNTRTIIKSEEKSKKP